MQVFHQQYRVITFVAEGGQGKIFVVEDQVDKTYKVLKLYEYKPSRAMIRYRPGRVEQQPYLGRLVDKVQEVMPYLSANQRLQRFLANHQEKIQSLEHCCILPIEKVILKEPFCFIYPLVRGGTLLAKAQKKRGLNFQEAGVFLAQLANTLDYLHLRKVFHRDIKPDNILVDKRDRIFLTDFDFAHFRVSELYDRMLSKKYCQRGTAYYMSPEHLRGRRPMETSDVYSLATTFYYCLALEYPFGEDLQSREDLKNYKAVKFLNKRQNNVLKGALEPDPKNRIVDAVTFYKELYSR